MKYQYLTNCIASNGEDINAMTSTARQITPATFARRCNYQHAATLLGYSDCPPGLTLANDYAVSFHKSRFQGRPCYYIRHSAIEYIFTEVSL